MANIINAEWFILSVINQEEDEYEHRHSDIHKH
jgi:hypothetical protein